ncbi:MAG: hypothetical protein ABIH85_02765 [Candidatus Omnitrophota bacterium]
MKKYYKTISLIVGLCFLANTTAYNMPINSVIEQLMIDELAAGSICNKMLGPVPYEKGTLKLALMASLRKIAGEKGEIDTKKMTEYALTYRNNVFDRRHFFLAEAGELSNDLVWVKCRIEEENADYFLQNLPRIDSYQKMKDNVLHTYYAVFPKIRGDNFFDIKMYTEEEWNKKWKNIYETAQSAEERRTSDETEEEMGVDRYIYEHKLNIDQFIEKHITEDNFAEIEGRAESEELEWDKKYPNRIKPTKFFSKKVWDFLQFNINPFLAYFSGSIDKAFRKKNIVFIRVLHNEDFPTIREREQLIPVTSHVSDNAVYVFLKEQNFDNFFKKSQEVDASKLFEKWDNWGEDSWEKDVWDTSEEWSDFQGTVIFYNFIRNCVMPHVIHEIGASYNFEYSLEDYSIINNLDVVWKDYQNKLHKFILAGNDFTQFDYSTFAEKFKKACLELGKLKGEPVKLDENILTRDYAGTENESILSKIKNFFTRPNVIKMFLSECQNLSQDELEWLVELYSNESLWYDIVERKKVGDEYAQIRARCIEAIKKLTQIIRELAYGCNGKVNFRNDGKDKIGFIKKWENIDLIGGVDILFEALKIKKAAGRFFVGLGQMRFNPVQDEELKPIALLEKDARGIFEEMIQHEIQRLSRDDVATILKNNLGDFPFTYSKKVRRDPYMFDGQPYDNVFHLEKGEEIKDGVFMVPCSTWYNDRQHQYNVLIEVKKENLKINVINPEEREAVEICLKNGFVMDFERDLADRQVMDRYLEHEEKIDTVIRDAIRRGDYRVFDVKKNNSLHQVKDDLMNVFARVLAVRSMNIFSQSQIVSTIFDSMESIMIINVGKEENLPKITVNRSTKGGDDDIPVEKEVTVRAHTGARGRYLFLTQDEYSKLNDLDKKENEKLKSDIKEWIMYEFGVPLGLSEIVFDMQKGSLSNNFSELYAHYYKSETKYEYDSYDDFCLDPNAEKNQNELSLKFNQTELARIVDSGRENPFVDINKLRGTNAAGLDFERDYATGLFDNRPINWMKKIARKVYIKTFVEQHDLKMKFLEVCGSITEKTLEDLIEIYDPKTLLLDSKRNFERDNECRRTLECVLVKGNISEIEYDVAGRIKIDVMGGVETLKTALELKRGLDDWNLKDGTAALRHLPDEELKAVALLEKDIRDVVLKHEGKLQGKKIKVHRDLSNPYGSQYDSIFDFTRTHVGVDVLEPRSWLIPCWSRKKNSGEYNKYYINVPDTDFVNWKRYKSCKILTQSEMESLRNIYKKGGLNLLVTRSAEDKEEIDRYLEHERKIDTVIDDAIRDGRFMWVSKFNSKLFLGIQRKIEAIFGYFCSIENKGELIGELCGSSFMLINVGDEENLPKTEMRIKDEWKGVTCRMHTGSRGKYIFLTDKEYKSYHGINDFPDKNLKSKTDELITRCVIHDSGNKLGLNVIGVDDATEGSFLLNEMDLAYKKLKRIKAGEDKDWDKSEFSELSLILKKENPLVDLNNLRGTNFAGKRYVRDYTAGPVNEKKKEALAIRVGEQIAPPKANYTLFVLQDFVSDEEWKDDRAEYASRFGLERIGTNKPHEVVEDILERIKELSQSDENFSTKDVIVQLPKEFAKTAEAYLSYVEELKKKASGIQFIVVDTAMGELKYENGRHEYRRKMYTIMRLIKKLDEDISPELEADINVSLRELMRNCLTNVDGATDSLYENYISARAKNKIVDILKTVLLYKPATALPDPDLEKTVYMLTFA